MIDINELRQKCQNKWHGILTELGVPGEYLTGKHSPCLFCKGTDRWRWDNNNGNGSYFCNQCGAGDGFTLVQKHLGVNFQEAIENVAKIVGNCNTMENNTQTKMTDDEKKIMLNKLWTKSTPVGGSDHIAKYLHLRGLVLTPNNIRYTMSCYESLTETYLPAMIGKIVNSKNIPIALHRTYLNPNSPQKAEIESNRKNTPSLEPLLGSCIRLFEPIDGEIIVCEGIETGIACKQIFNNSGVFSCISNIIMESFVVPDGITSVVICGDADASYVGQTSAYALAKRLVKEKYIVEVLIPSKIGQDWNDVLLKNNLRSS